MQPPKLQKPHRSVLRKAGLLFILVSGILIAADQLSLYFGLGRWQRMVDDLLGGLIAASTFYLYERHRLRRFAERLHVIDLMNHHIRNALQPLIFVSDEPVTRTQMKLVDDCVRYIDWALREVLPGHSEEEFAVNDGGFGAKSVLPLSSLRLRSSPAGSPRQEPFFGHWLDAWKSRNFGARQ
jgi:hypothetical protein